MSEISGKGSNALSQGTTRRQPDSNLPPYNRSTPPQQRPPQQQQRAPMPPVQSQPAAQPVAPPQPQTWSSELRSMKIPAWTILPLRFFLGFSFLAGGWDKLTDPTYLNPSSPSYIGTQISQFAPGTPLEGFLLNFAVPNATLFGVLVMGGEFCIGIAVLLGLFTRFSAAMGLLLNLTFYLSATWNVHPFFLGSDLPYVFGWLTLLLAGPGPFALDTRVREWLAPAPISYVSRGRIVTVDDTGTAMTRRAFLGAGGAGLVVLTIAAVGVGWGVINSGKKSSVASVPPSSAPTQAPTQAPTSIPPNPPAGQGGGAVAPTSPAQPTAAPAVEPTATTASAVSGLTKVAGPNDVPVNQSLDFTLPTGDPAVLVHNSSGYSAYVAICTHQGCQVNYYPQYQIIGCPCHGAEFDPVNSGQVLRGPARRPLSPVALTTGPDGSVYLAG